MKKIQLINKLVLTLLIVLTIGCVNDDEITIAPYRKTLLYQNFDAGIDGTDLDFAGWENFAIVGTKKWKEEIFEGNGYAELSAFASGNTVNESWLVTPEINLEGYKSLQVLFDIAQHHLDVDAIGNSLKIYYSNSYNGNVTTTTWTDITELSNIPKKATSWYVFLNTNYTFSSEGKVRIAFKFLGSGTNTTLDGAFQLDNVTVFGIQ